MTNIKSKFVKNLIKKDHTIFKNILLINSYEIHLVYGQMIKVKGKTKKCQAIFHKIIILKVNHHFY